MNENNEQPMVPDLEQSTFDDTERMAGQSVRGFIATPLDEHGKPEEYFVRDPGDPDKLTTITPKEATKLILRGKGSGIVKSWQLPKED